MTDTFAAQYELSSEALRLFHTTEAPTLTSEEFALFVFRCEQRGVDPLSRMIIPQLRIDNKGGRRVIDITTIEAYRALAEDTGEYRGQDSPLWKGKGTEWLDVWVDDDNPPAAARVQIYREGYQPTSQTAHWSEYVQTYQNAPNRVWRTMGRLMIAKCSEALGFRKLFPRALGGTYTSDEMAQANNDESLVIDTHTAELQARNKTKTEIWAEPHLIEWSDARDRARAFMKKIPTDAKRNKAITGFLETLEAWWIENGAAFVELQDENDTVANRVLDKIDRHMRNAAKHLGADTMRTASDLIKYRLEMQRKGTEDEPTTEDAEDPGPSDDDQ